MPGSSPGMTNQRFAVALREVRRRMGRDGSLEQLRAEVNFPKDQQNSTEGDAFLEAALAELAPELCRLEGGESTR